MRAADPLAGDRRRATNAAAQLPQSRGVVDRRRAGRRQWTASWALAGAPRGRRGDPPAAAVRGAEAHTSSFGTQHVRPCRVAHGCAVAGRRAASTTEQSASGRSARRVRGGTMLLAACTTGAAAGVGALIWAAPTARQPGLLGRVRRALGRSTHSGEVHVSLRFRRAKLGCQCGARQGSQRISARPLALEWLWLCRSRHTSSFGGCGRVGL